MTSPATTTVLAADADGSSVDGYNFAYLDEQTKRMIRRAILKGLAIPGYQVPFASREMPMPYGWGTGGVQVSVPVRQDCTYACSASACSISFPGQHP